MLYLLTQHLTVFYSGFNVFSYLTLRAILACMSSLLFALLIGPSMIARLSQYQIGRSYATTVRSRICRRPGRPRWAGR